MGENRRFSPIQKVNFKDSRKGEAYEKMGSNSRSYCFARPGYGMFDARRSGRSNRHWRADSGDCAIGHSHPGAYRRPDQKSRWAADA
jgi:hypothetical protein